MWTTAQHSLLKCYLAEDQKAEANYEKTRIPLTDWQVDFEWWYQAGQLAYMLRLPRHLYKRQLLGVISNWPKTVERWHIKAYFYALKGYNSRFKPPRLVSDSYQYPFAPAGWFLDFIVFPNGSVSMDFFHPNHNETYCSREGLETLPLPLDEKGANVLTWSMLERLHFKYMSTSTHVSASASPKSHLNPV